DNLTITHGILGISSLGGLDLHDVTVDHNEGLPYAGRTGGGGGGISVSDRNGVSTFTNVNVTNNENVPFPAMGGSAGPGVFVDATTDGTALVWHGGTISGNEATCCGSAIYGRGTSQTSADSMLLDHLTITNNYPNALITGSATITDSSI